MMTQNHSPYFKRWLIYAQCWIAFHTTRWYQKFSSRSAVCREGLYLTDVYTVTLKIILLHGNTVFLAFLSLLEHLFILKSRSMLKHHVKVMWINPYNTSTVAITL